MLHKEDKPSFYFTLILHNEWKVQIVENIVYRWMVNNKQTRGVGFHSSRRRVNKGFERFEVQRVMSRKVICNNVIFLISQIRNYRFSLKI